MDMLRSFLEAHQEKLATLPIKKTDLIIGVFLCVSLCFDRVVPCLFVCLFFFYCFSSPPEHWLVLHAFGTNSHANLCALSPTEVPDEVFVVDETQREELVEELRAELEGMPKSFSAEGKTLEDLIQFGLAAEPVATEVFVRLYEELTRVVDFPVLIAVDEYNALFGKTIFGDPEKIHPDLTKLAPLMPAKKLTLVKLLTGLPVHNLVGLSHFFFSHVFRTLFSSWLVLFFCTCVCVCVCVCFMWVCCVCGCVWQYFAYFFPCRSRALAYDSHLSFLLFR
jgi:Mitochondrial ribosomal death-associated protein 3